MTRATTFTTLVASIILLTTSSSQAKVIYVDWSATGSNDGGSWENAFIELTTALAAALAGDEVWVAEGVYRPAPPNGDRSATFDLKSGVAVYGGFLGVESSEAERAPDLYPCILSGDLNGDDEFGATNVQENSCNVVTATSCDENTILDGFVIERGYADSEPNCWRGAGIYIDEGHPIIRDCLFRHNKSLFSGGGVYVYWGSPSFEKCRFFMNGQRRGGALYLSLHQGDHCSISDSFFGRNHASATGGAIYLTGGGIGSQQQPIRRKFI